MTEGNVFAFHCQGSYLTPWEIPKFVPKGDVFRFGSTTKFKLDRRYEAGDQKLVFLGRMFSGLNQPRDVLFFEKVNDVRRAWDVVKDFLRAHSTAWASKDFQINQEQALGDTFFTANVSVQEFRKHLQDGLLTRLRQENLLASTEEAL